CFASKLRMFKPRPLGPTPRPDPTHRQVQPPKQRGAKHELQKQQKPMRPAITNPRRAKSAQANAALLAFQGANAADAALHANISAPRPRLQMQQRRAWGNVTSLKLFLPFSALEDAAEAENCGREAGSRPVR